MKKIIITLLAALALGAQAQQFVPKHHPQCMHGRDTVFDLNYRNGRTVLLEYCPGWEGIQSKSICIDVEHDHNHIRCFHSEYVTEQMLDGKTTRTCYFRRVRNQLAVACSDPQRYRLSPQNKMSFGN